MTGNEAECEQLVWIPKSLVRVFLSMHTSGGKGLFQYGGVQN